MKEDKKRRFLEIYNKAEEFPMSGTEQTIIDKAYSGYVFSSKTTQAEQTVYTFDNKTGTGQMCCYTLCDGIQLSYNTLYLIKR